MAFTFRRRYRDQLPRRQHMTAERVITFWGSVASIVALWLVFFPPVDWSSYTKSTILALLVFIIAFGLLFLILTRLLSKPHRYAQAVYYTHYVNHIVRDFISDVQSGRPADLKATLDDVADAVAACFSVITAKRCRCVIKEVTPERYVVSVARDAVSKVGGRRAEPEDHPLENNSDFSDLWYGRNGCLRYFFCNNLLWMFKTHRYRNTSFDSYGEPIVRSVLGWSWVANWHLPYRATIIWPIRHISNYEYWPPAKGHGPPPDQAPHIWGFLCVDCNSRYVFDERYAPELGAGFSDALYTMFSTARRQQATAVSNQHQKETSKSENG
jgi:hypothetical protein